MLINSRLAGSVARLATGICAALLLSHSPSRAETIDPEDFIAFDQAQARLGQLLFYDKILSGNMNISCATCHHHSTFSADGVSLGIGEGGIGIGPERVASPMQGVMIHERIPRNAPALWNLGHKDMAVMFHDGRVHREENADGSYTFISPSGAPLPDGLNSSLAAQALFPISSASEMAGQEGENEINAAFAEGLEQGWEAVAARVRSKSAYETAFMVAFDDVQSADDITIVHIANAIAAFEGTEWRSTNSPYDDYIRNGTPLEPLAERGRELFFGEAGCSNCHNGPLFTNQQFYAVGLPHFGPGRPFEGNPLPRDMGRMENTHDPADAYKFRVPGLRNVALTGPYGHNGAYTSLRDMIRHMCDPVTMRNSWTPGMARLPNVPWIADRDFTMISHAEETERQMQSLDITAVDMVDEDIDALEAFLNALTDRDFANRPMGRPDRVPSGLSVD